jgi:hypothetical protein
MHARARQGERAPRGKKIGLGGTRDRRGTHVGGSRRTPRSLSAAGIDKNLAQGWSVGVRGEADFQ